jgi:catechol 2,3-dioxygenase-like lactoylglutathione lyase family enzyme
MTRRSKGNGLIQGFDHVQIAAPVGCEDAARRFYGGLLGLRELEKPEILRARGGGFGLPAANTSFTLG